MYKNKKRKYIKQHCPIVMAYDLSEGHYKAENELLFDGYDELGNPYIGADINNRHTAFQDSIMINNGNERYFIKKDIFQKTYCFVDPIQEIQAMSKETINNGHKAQALKIHKFAYDMSNGHYDENGKLLFSRYDENQNPVLETLENKAYVGTINDFIVIGLHDEKHMVDKDTFLKLYKPSL